MIRVLIERRLKKETEEAMQKAMREIRREAIHRPGYVSGETHRDVSDPLRYIILSTWRSREDWEAWASSDARRKIEGRIGSMLAEPERITVLEPV